jgi:hypothetical protein
MDGAQAAIHDNDRRRERRTSMTALVRHGDGKPAGFLRQVVLLVTGRGVVVDKRDIIDVDETEFLLRDDANRRHLEESIQELRDGHVHSDKVA